MTELLAAVLLLAAGYGLGRWQPLHRVSDWANWQRYGKSTGARYWAMWAVLSVENIGWLLAHPVQGRDNWKHRHDPPPPPGPPVRIRTQHTEGAGE
ncbi:hypothetical protein ACFVJK_46865 [Streptomyces sp. NPDC127172]|uniref:hypothetical protein n=1 Tax=Streptomyces sp. NPDC127172 TaxID=3345382 RepID=UPI003627B841